MSKLKNVQKIIIITITCWLQSFVRALPLPLLIALPCVELDSTPLGKKNQTIDDTYVNASLDDFVRSNYVAEVVCFQEPFQGFNIEHMRSASSFVHCETFVSVQLGNDSVTCLSFSV